MVRATHFMLTIYLATLVILCFRTFTYKENFTQRVMRIEVNRTEAWTYELFHIILPLWYRRFFHHILEANQTDGLLIFSTLYYHCNTRLTTTVMLCLIWTTPGDFTERVRPTGSRYPTGLLSTLYYHTVLNSHFELTTYTSPL